MEFPDKELSTLLELPDFLKSNCARMVLPGLLDLTSLEEFLLGGFASHGRSKLPLDWLLPQSRWPSLCSHLGQLLGWQTMTGTFPHPPAILPPLPTSQPLPNSSPPPSQVRAFWLGMGGVLVKVASSPSLPAPSFPLLVGVPHFSLLFSFLGVTLVLTIL